MQCRRFICSSAERIAHPETSWEPEDACVAALGNAEVAFLPRALQVAADPEASGYDSWHIPDFCFVIYLWGLPVSFSA